MDKRTAKREACWIAAQLIRSTLDAGFDLQVDPRLTPGDAVLIEQQLMVVLGELERRGHR